jgi:hypothetical protein
MRDRLRAYAALRQVDDHYQLDVPSGETVGRLLIDYQFTLQLEKSGLSIVIEQPFSLTTGTRTMNLDIEPAERLAPALSLVRKRVTSITVHDSGDLKVVLEGHVIKVAPNPSYEAWQIAGASGVIAVCMAGGELGVWASTA